MRGRAGPREGRAPRRVWEQPRPKCLPGISGVTVTVTACVLGSGTFVLWAAAESGDIPSKIRTSHPRTRPASQSAAASPVTTAPLLPPGLKLDSPQGALPMLCGLGHCGQGAVLDPLLPPVVLPHVGLLHSSTHPFLLCPGPCAGLKLDPEDAGPSLGEGREGTCIQQPSFLLPPTGCSWGRRCWRERRPARCVWKGGEGCPRAFQES